MPPSIVDMGIANPIGPREPRVVMALKAGLQRNPGQTLLGAIGANDVGALPAPRIRCNTMVPALFRGIIGSSPLMTIPPPLEVPVQAIHRHVAG